MTQFLRVQFDRHRKVTFFGHLLSKQSYQLHFKELRKVILQELSPMIPVIPPPTPRPPRLHFFIYTAHPRHFQAIEDKLEHWTAVYLVPVFVLLYIQFHTCAL